MPLSMLITMFVRRSPHQPGMSRGVAARGCAIICASIYYGRLDLLGNPFMTLRRWQLQSREMTS